jgi:hypothetical protein
MLRTGSDCGVASSGGALTRLYVVCAKGVSEDVLACLFRAFPGLEYCDLKRDHLTGASRVRCFCRPHPGTACRCPEPGVMPMVFTCISWINAGPRSQAQTLTHHAGQTAQISSRAPHMYLPWQGIVGRARLLQAWEAPRVLCMQRKDYVCSVK